MEGKRIALLISRGLASMSTLFAQPDDKLLSAEHRKPKQEDSETPLSFTVSVNADRRRIFQLLSTWRHGSMFPDATRRVPSMWQAIPMAFTSNISTKLETRLRWLGHIRPVAHRKPTSCGAEKALVSRTQAL